MPTSLRLTSDAVEGRRPNADLSEVVAAGYQGDHDAHLYRCQLLANAITWTPLERSPRTGWDLVRITFLKPTFRYKCVGGLAEDSGVSLDDREDVIDQHGIYDKLASLGPERV